MKPVAILLLITTLSSSSSAMSALFGGKSSEILEIVGIATACNGDGECSHGQCDMKTKTCTCDLGWTGGTCNEMVTYQKSGASSTEQSNSDQSYLVDILNTVRQTTRARNRPLDLSAGVRFKSAPKIKVELVKNRVTERPIAVTKLVPSLVPSNLRLQTADLEALVIAMEEKDACSNKYKMKSKEERLCSTGLECKYGHCSSANYGSYIAFECKCDRGAKGLLCEKKCCLKCGKNGRCDFYPDGTPFCFCRRGFYGNRCEFSFTKMLQKDIVPIHATSSSLRHQL